MTAFEQQLEQLITQQITKIEITKDEFYAFREVLVKHPKFKHIRGIAHQGGKVTYTYLEVPRS
ncbi:MAG: hypothetical protein KIG60_04960 [Caryophanon sp.]|nr:hypothetical protein [Caryophanon sp.]